MYQQQRAESALPTTNTCQVLLSQLNEAQQQQIQLESKAQRGEPLDANEVSRVFSLQGQLLAVRGRQGEAADAIATGQRILKKAQGCKPEHELALREASAALLASTCAFHDAINAYEELYFSWKRLGDEQGMAAALFSVIELYARTNQPRLGWTAYAGNAGLFERTGHASTTVFVSTLLDIAQQMGNSSVTAPLEHWLALVEDLEWEPCPNRQARNKKDFDEHNSNTGGLSGLLGLACQQDSPAHAR